METTTETPTADAAGRVAEILAAGKTRLSLSNAEIARRAEVHASTVSRALSGKARPTKFVARQIASALSFNKAETRRLIALLDDEDDHAGVEDVREAVASTVEQALEPAVDSFVVGTQRIGALAEELAATLERIQTSLVKQRPRTGAGLKPTKIVNDLAGLTAARLRSMGNNKLDQLVYGFQAWIYPQADVEQLRRRRLLLDPDAMREALAIARSYFGARSVRSAANANRCARLVWAIAPVVSTTEYIQHVALQIEHVPQNSPMQMRSTRSKKRLSDDWCNFYKNVRSIPQEVGRQWIAQRQENTSPSAPDDRTALLAQAVRSIDQLSVGDLSDQVTLAICHTVDESEPQARLAVAAETVVVRAALLSAKPDELKDFLAVSSKFAWHTLQYGEPILGRVRLSKAGVEDFDRALIEELDDASRFLPVWHVAEDAREALTFTLVERMIPSAPAAQLRSLLNWLVATEHKAVEALRRSLPGTLSDYQSAGIDVESWFAPIVDGGSEPEMADDAALRVAVVKMARDIATRSKQRRQEAWSELLRFREF